MKRKTNFAFLVVIILAVIASSGMATGFVNAQEGALDPNTPVSNTDGILPMPEISSTDFSNPRSGTGRLAKSNTTIPEADLNIPPLGSGSPESIIGADGRTRVNPTTAFPYRAIAYLVVTFPHSSGSCTGWFIGPRTVITAGHCVYDTSLNEWATSIKVYPGRNGASAPYGVTTSHHLYSVTGWTVNEVSGYPGDKPAGQQWKMSGPITNVGAFRFWYNIDTFGGQSGSPFFQWWTGSGCTSSCYYGVGIHTYGTSVAPNFGNSATRIRQAVYNNFQTWKAQPYP
jgi:glutamyl endopeptidase